MKKIFVLLFVLASQIFYAQQSGTIVYKVEPAESFESWVDAITKGKENDRAAQYVQNYIRKNARLLPFLEFKMNFNAEEMIFKQTETMASDDNVDLKVAAGTAGVEGTYYLNQKESIALHQFGSNPGWLIHSDLKELEWKITNETKEIKGFQTFKAIAEIDLNAVKKGEIIAWFAPNLPYQYGPAGIYGLPGLILVLERNHYYFYADEIKLDKKTQKIKRPHKGKKATREEYFEAMENPFGD